MRQSKLLMHLALSVYRNAKNTDSKNTITSQGQVRGSAFSNPACFDCVHPIAALHILYSMLHE